MAQALKCVVLLSVVSTALIAPVQADAHCGCEDDELLKTLRSGATGGDPLAATTQAFMPLPSKAAVLVVSAHPDDEGLFFGGSLPYYSQVRNLPTVLLGVTSGDSGGVPSSDPFLRERELREAASVYGLKYEPIFARFDDGAGNANTTPALTSGVTSWNQFPNTGDDTADFQNGSTGNPVEYAARLIRQLKPEVIVTSDNEGDYGHRDHKHTSDAVVAAYKMAGDASVTLLDDQGNALSTWTATKLYVHDAQFNDVGDGSGHEGHLFHTRWETAYDELGGKTAREITDEALTKHQSQRIPASRTYFDPNATDFAGKYLPSELWTLLESTVGPDTPGSGVLGSDPNFSSFTDVAYGDFFEGIDLSPFASYLADANRDGTVDGDDLAIMQANLGQSVAAGSVGSGDANGDGQVTQADLDLYNLATVPEPASVALLGLCGVLLLRRRK